MDVPRSQDGHQTAYASAEHPHEMDLTRFLHRVTTARGGRNPPTWGVSFLFRSSLQIFSYNFFQAARPRSNSPGSARTPTLIKQMPIRVTRVFPPIGLYR